MAELKDILKELGLRSERVETDESKSQRYAAEYGLLRPPSGYEIARIEEIKRKKKYCECCEGLKSCQYSGGDVGLEGIIIVNDLGGRLSGNRLYFGVKECRYLVEAEELKKIEILRRESGLPERHKHKRKYDLNGEEREAVNRLLRGESKRLYIEGEYRKSEELLSIIGNEYLRQGLKVRYENATGLMSDLRVTNPRYHEKVGEMKSIEVLIIERLKEMSRYNDEQIGLIINYRNRLGKRTVVNGVKRLAEMSGMTGEELKSFEEVRIE